MNYDTYAGLFNVDLLERATPSGPMGLPYIHRTNATPSKLIPFNKAIRAANTDQWVHFFIHDYLFSRLWKQPWRYLPILAKFSGVISPDFSVFWKLPLYVQLESIGKSRQIACWLQQNGITVIPCIRWGKEDTYLYAFDGIQPGGTVAVGTAGCMREKQERRIFEEGFHAMIDTIKPQKVVVYGSISRSIRDKASNSGTVLLPFRTDTSVYFEKRGA